MSYIHYKFKSAIAHDSLVVDGMGLSAFDFKREIVRAKKLKGEDFELVLSNAESHEEYKDDRSLVPRNSSIIVRRIPVPDAKKRGVLAGTAKYNTDDLHMSVPPLASNDINISQFLQQQQQNQQNNPIEIDPVDNRNSQQMPSMFGSSGGRSRGIPGLGAAGIPGIVGFRDDDDQAMTEEERIRAVISEGSSYWQETQDKLGYMKRVPFSNYSGPARPGNSRDFGANNHEGGGNQAINRSGGTGTRNIDRGQGGHGPSRPPPTNYVCHRCGVKGHYIQDCPTNGDNSFDKPKIKRTTGIPRSFLREVDPTNLGADAQAVMINPDGKVVQFVSNEGEWNRIQSRLAVSMPPKEELPDIDMTVPEDLRCNLCLQLVREAVEISCCRKLYCDSCLRRHLSTQESLGVCPSCSAHISSPDEIIPANDTRRRAAQCIRDRIVRQSLVHSSTPQPPPTDQCVSDSSAVQRVSQVNLGGTSLQQRMSLRSDPNQPANKRSSAVNPNSDYPNKRTHY